MSTMNETHKAKLKVAWNGGFSGKGHVASRDFTTAVSLPKEFGGLGVGTSPEDLFLASIASCYLITFGIILDKANVSYQSLTVDGVLVTQTGPPALIDEVVLIVQVVTEAPREKLEQLAERVDGFCLIAKAVKGGVKKTVQIVQKFPSDQSLLEIGGIR